MYEWNYKLPVQTDPAELLKSCAPEDPVCLYLKEIIHCKPLSEQEEARLALQLAAGSQEARDRLTEANVGMVVAVAELYRHKGMDILDLIQAGNYALINAPDTFNPEKTTFSRHVANCVHGAIQRELAELRPQVRFTPEVLENIRKAIELSGNPEPDDAEMDFVFDDAIDSEETECDPLEELLSSMMPREAELLRMRLGLTDGKRYSREECAQVFGITPERVRQVERKMMRRYCRMGRSRNYLDFFEAYPELREEKK